MIPVDLRRSALLFCDDLREILFPDCRCRKAVVSRRFTLISYADFR
jgi:hypothetical protein